VRGPNGAPAPLRRVIALPDQPVYPTQ
jgi:hypothetical protein